jgi:hypothetical protein
MEKNLVSSRHSQVLGIFIFYQEPEKSYWNTLKCFLNLSLGLKSTDIYKYSILNYREDLGYLDIISLILEDISKIKQTTYHNIIIYIENSILLATNYHKDIFWYRIFDIFDVEYIIYLYKEQLDFDPFLFQYRISCHNENLKIDDTKLDHSLKNQLIILDNINIEEFCNCILNCTFKIRLLDYIVERYTLDEQLTISYTNFVPTNEIYLLNNFYLLGINNKIDKSTIIPIFVSNVSFKLLHILYSELKSLQKKRLLNCLLI